MKRLGIAALLMGIPITVAVPVGAATTAPSPKPSPPKAQPSEAQKKAERERYARRAFRWITGIGSMPDVPEGKVSDFTEKEKGQWEGTFTVISLMCRGIQAERAQMKVPPEFQSCDQKLLASVATLQLSANKALTEEPGMAKDLVLFADQFGKAADEFADLIERFQIDPTTR